MKTKKEKSNTVVRLDNGMEIRTDPRCWVLFTPSPRSYKYFRSLDQLFTEVLNIRTKELAVVDPRKTIESLAQAILQANDEITGVVKKLMTVKIPAYSRLGLHDGVVGGQDD